MTTQEDRGCPARGRLLVVAAAVLWSLSGAFTNALREPTALGLHDPQLPPLQIAAGRVLFAGLVFVPFLRPRYMCFRFATVWTAVSFAAMNAMFVSALALGSAANAILLQYTAPLWLFLASVFFLGEKTDQRGTVSLVLGLVGVAVLLYGGWEAGQPFVLLLGLGSGLTYALILLGLQAQRQASALFAVVVNHLFSAVVLAPFVWNDGLPTTPQVLWLMLFGAVQLGLPYLLVARGLKTVSAREAGAISLIEPILNPIWAYLIAPDKERPTEYVLLGGACILGALVYRYWPFGVWRKTQG